MRKSFSLIAMLAAAAMALALAVGGSAAFARGKQVKLNVVLNTDATASALAKLGEYGKVREVLYEIDAVVMQASEDSVQAIKALPFVEAANPDAERTGAPIDTVSATDFLNGINTWDLDAVNVTDFGWVERWAMTARAYTSPCSTRACSTPGGSTSRRSGSRPSTRSLSGAVASENVSEQPNKWEHDQNSHGTHVTSTILGYSLRGTPVNGVAPKVRVIPVKVLGQAGFGSSSTVAAGIVYATDLKLGPLSELAGSHQHEPRRAELDAVEQAAIDYAIANGVIVVASAGNAGAAGMGYPGAYAPVISAAASGWIGEWFPNNSWWFSQNVPDPTNAPTSTSPTSRAASLPARISTLLPRGRGSWGRFSSRAARRRTSSSVERAWRRLTSPALPPS